MVNDLSARSRLTATISLYIYKLVDASLGSTFSTAFF